MLSIFKAQIINFDVQKARAKGLCIPHELSPEWGMVQIREIEAITQIDALVALSVCYPKQLGFKVLSIEPIDSSARLTLQDVFSDAKISV